MTAVAQRLPELSRTLAWLSGGLASSRRCRMRLMSDAVFCVQRNLASAFYVNRAAFQHCIPDLKRKRLRMVVRHPLGKLTYAFDKKNSDKIKTWLASSPAQAS